MLPDFLPFLPGHRLLASTGTVEKWDIWLVQCLTTSLQKSNRVQNQLNYSPGLNICNIWVCVSLKWSQFKIFYVLLLELSHDSLQFIYVHYLVVLSHEPKSNHVYSPSLYNYTFSSNLSHGTLLHPSCKECDHAV